MTNRCIGLAGFEFNRGIGPDELRDRVAAGSARLLARCVGFIARRTLPVGDEVADYAERTDRKSARAAMAAAERLERIAPSVGLLDLGSARMRHSAAIA